MKKYAQSLKTIIITLKLKKGVSYAFRKSTKTGGTL